MDAHRLARSISSAQLQQDRLMKLDVPVGTAALLPQRASGRARLGRHYEFTIDVVSADDSVELKALIAQPVTLWIQQSDRSYRPHHGYVHTARRLGADGGLAYYQITFASWMHFLKFRRDQRIWQDRPVDEIVTDVFNRHPQARGAFEFNLAKALPSRSFCRQDESDWNFVHRLLEDEGLYGFWEQASDGRSHSLTITDRLSALKPLGTVRFYRSGTDGEVDALTQWSGTRALQSTTYTTRTFDYKRPAAARHPKETSLPTQPGQGALPEQAEVYEYTGAYTYLAQSRGDALTRFRMEEWESRAERFEGEGGWRAIDVGQRFMLADHPGHERDSVEQREFATVEAGWLIANNIPIGANDARFPHSLRARFNDARSGRSDSSAFAVPHVDGSAGYYRVTIEAQRTAVPFRSPFEHRKPATHLETAIVVGRKGEEVHTDELNRIKVRFVWDRQNPGDEGASCWIRIVQSDTGGGYGAVHPPRVGEEVLIDYIGGDCDRPVAVARVYNGATQPQWHSNGILSGNRSKEYGGRGYNQLVFDDATGQNRVQLHSSPGNSQLHLGYLIQQTGNTRGEYLGSGFDLRTDAYGALRATRGLYLGTHSTSARSQSLDVREARQQLVNAESVIEALSQASAAHLAESLAPGFEAMKQYTDATRNTVGGDASGGRTAGGGTGNANAFKQPLMLFASPAGIGLSTRQTVHVSAEQHVNMVSGESVHVAAGRSVVASIADRISIFVQKAGMKLFAGKGKIEIQAHADNIELTAQKSVKVLSATERIEVAAKQEILLTSGGAYIRLSGGNIEIHAPGKIGIKGGTHNFSGPVSLPYPMPLPPDAVCAPCLMKQAAARSAFVTQGA
ncbi:type VI secretion system Vgr family protein [Burkholderia sp. FERM BP-3421]|uniref:type VI secretion system Vgr family protein n=1 Tax=Burkholderia sp. FERM BP-3421 TaxID=1494466 RepID=UPI003082644F